MNMPRAYFDTTFYDFVDKGWIRQSISIAFKPCSRAAESCATSAWPALAG
jgi:hypothetical protein